jgi:integrase/recombinase XerD
MTPLRQRFIEDMQMRGLAPTTQRSYIHYAAEFAKFYNTSPEKLDLEVIRQYEMHLLNERKLAPQSVNAFVASMQFLYTVTLEMPWGKECFPRVRVASKLPVVLDPEEITEFFDYVPSMKYRAALMLCYGAGLRLGEAVTVKVEDIDSKRMLIHIQKGKGNKDRYVMLSPRLLAVLRRYWRAARPDKWMFPSWGGKRHLSPNSLSQACRDAARQSGLGKRITAHMLRHYAASRTMPQVDVATAVHGPPSGGCAAYFASLPGTLGK